MIQTQILHEAPFSPHRLNKYASLHACGNGRIGIRGCHEEAYTDQQRGMFVAGFYHRANATEVTELVNLPDITGMRIELDGESLSLLSGTRVSYQRELRTMNGELYRELVWQSPAGQRFRIETRRFVALLPLALVACRLTVTALDAAAHLGVSTGIDATQTNSGRQHLNERSVRVFDQNVLQGGYDTTDGQQQTMITSQCRIPSGASSSFSAKNRRLLQHISLPLPAGEAVTLEKFSWIATSLDADFLPESDWSSRCLASLSACAQQGYGHLLMENTRHWQHYWQDSRVCVTSDHPQDQRALDFALYHLKLMIPAHDARASVAAKGLTGEGYKGHVFWDTEIFILPFALLNAPEQARKLLEYRYLNLTQAQEKARRSGYQGALFPWECAFSGEEETPEFAAINIRTGQRQRVASAMAEHHLVADIAYATVGYFQATHDREFMQQMGLALLKETALFWMSRAQRRGDRLDILNVIGPDEYTEHVDNNAFTNYMAHDNVQAACRYLRECDQQDAAFLAQAEDFLAHLYLPQPDEQGVIAQDDTFFSKPQCDLTAYKSQQGTQAILLDYSRAEINEMQVLKQADVVMLMHLLPEKFTSGCLSANLAFYEPRTIHDSSLSKSVHGIVAARSGQTAQALQFYREACRIDLGEEPHSSDDGIHAAATAAIWLGAVTGFAGLTYQSGELHFRPSLPPGWTRLQFPVRWRGACLTVCLEPQQFILSKTDAQPLTVRINGTAHTFTESLVLKGTHDEN
ncbi:glycosyl hydrolase family 65 [Rahnella victoriana]|uniref:glycoside hydrolase family 65 protein n=1 Tax=Rahnella victoriana TaxID=1510570 RepID=UPI000BB1A5F8|nr:glycoside hydrolase family 65 protein [Rahnella victoriana]PBI81632.1 glycosyl hydrolase family 65 [Rahnella victoriana]